MDLVTRRWDGIVWTGSEVILELSLHGVVLRPSADLAGIERREREAVGGFPVEAGLDRQGVAVDRHALHREGGRAGSEGFERAGRTSPKAWRHPRKAWAQIGAAA